MSFQRVVVRRALAQRLSPHRAALVASLPRCRTINSSTPTSPPPPTRTPGFLLRSPTFISFAKAFARVAGRTSKTTTAIRDTRGMYELCKTRYDDESAFILNECGLPPTYQTWFLITNIHVWLLTVRLRALPPSHGRAYVQELVNHFFYNVEDRMRSVLGDRAPDRVVRSYLKEMRDQWAGVGAALDHGLVKGDAALAEVLWRNVFAAKTPAASASSSVEGVAERRKEKETVVEAPLKIKGRDAKDLEHLHTFIAFLRREAKRLEDIPDEEVMAGRIGVFGGIGSLEDAWEMPVQDSAFDASTVSHVVQEPLRASA